MTSAREVDFNALPLSVRQRFVAALKDGKVGDAPLAREVEGVVALSIGLAVLALLAWGGLASLGNGFGQLGDPNAWQGWSEALNISVWLAAALYAALALWRRIRMRRAVPYAPGRYLFPMDLVDAQTRQLKIRSLANLKLIQPVHQYIQGIYRRTVLNFQFDDGTSETLAVRGKKQAEQGVAQWQAKQAELRQAAQASDRAALARLDPFFDLRAAKWALDSPAATDGPIATGQAPAYLKWRAPIAIGAALIVALIALAVRNVASDQLIYEEALRRGTERAYLDYLSAGWRNVDQIRAGLPRVALSDAKKKASVTALRSVLQRYPGAGLDTEVATEIGSLYAAAFEAFRAQAATADPTLVPFMERLLSALKDTGGSTLQVRFTRPTIDALQAADARVAQRMGEAKAREFAPSASHFSSNSAAPRESRIVGEMNRGFRAIFPSDILTVAAAASPDARLPVLDIAYTITPSGAIYKLDEGNRFFVGVVAHFDVRMSLPGGSGDWRFQVEVQPPEHFTVNYQLPAGAQKVAPDERVYVVMAERAFDQLGLKLRTAFFKPESDAYRRAAGKQGI